ncbi:MAG TPA: 2-oxoglutarate dehydrogenase E1 component, partial [Syntrophobacteraceae bacterium]|nr:2-oxoglutarate dehydrogenase E1 component [Syntrophobacteraceae bacterium]
MVERIRQRPPVHELYAETLMADGLITKAQVQEIRTEILATLERAHRAARERTCVLSPAPGFQDAQGIGGDYHHESVDTGVGDSRLLDLAQRIHQVPAGFTIHSKLQRILQRRMEALIAGQGIDWAGAEALAFATLLAEGTSIRLSGEDSRRGTFSQRHSVLIDPNTEGHFAPLQTVAQPPTQFRVYDSMLSEF